MVETTLPDGLETSGRRAYRKFCHISRRFWVFAFLVIFSVFQKKMGFWVHPPMASVLLSASVERWFVSRMRDFLLYFLSINDANRTNQEILCLPYAYLKHRWSQAVLQSALLFNDSFIECLFMKLSIKPLHHFTSHCPICPTSFKVLKCWPKFFLLQHVSHITCCMSCGMCHMSCVKCNMLHVTWPM